MEIEIDAVYVRDSDINLRGNTLISLCYAAQKQYPGEIHGAQLVNGSWAIYTRSTNTRVSLTINGLNINGTNIKVYDDKPIPDGGLKTERVVIKDIPATIPPDRILAFLKGFPHITTRSRVLYAKERLGGEDLSPFINGDRIVYISANVSPPLPKESVICGHPCRIWHPSQKNFCKRCASHGHRTTDVDMCEAYEPDCLVSAWRGDNNPLSNFYRCTLTHEDKEFKSSEHFYQHEFATFMKRHDIANAIINAPTPKEAKQIASQLKTDEFTDQLARWAKIKVCVMNFILRIKWNCCTKFRQALQSTEGMVVAEATSCTFWGVGVAPNLAQHTKSTKFLGQNHMGKLQMALRCHVSQPDMLSENGEVTIPIKPDYYDHNPEATVSDILDYLTKSPALTCQGQGDSSSTMHVDPSTSPAVPPTSKDTDDVIVSSDVPKETSTTDPASESTSSLVKIDCVASVQPRINTTPAAPPRRTRTSVRPVKSSSSSSAKPALNTLDNFVNKDSPSCKRKPSGDAGSPSSNQYTKSSRTDETDTPS